jgi:DNA-binding transcriptional regulator YiaG
MKLRTYLNETGTTMTKFADQMGVGVSTVHGWLTGRRVPTLQSALRIKTMTNGHVAPEDWAVNTPGSEAA